MQINRLLNVCGVVWRHQEEPTFMRRSPRLVLGIAVTAALTFMAPSGAALADGGGRPFTMELTGEAEVTAAGVPNQGDLDGTGTATVRLNPGQEEVCYEISVAGIVLPASAAHIHVAPSTTTGPVVIGLSAPDAAGNASGCVSASRQLIKAIMQHPENYYVNVHNSVYPAGALRGQLR